MQIFSAEGPLSEAKTGHILGIKMLRQAAKDGYLRMEKGEPAKQATKEFFDSNYVLGDFDKKIEPDENSEYDPEIVSSRK